MNKYFYRFFALFAAIIVFAACEKEELQPEITASLSTNSYTLSEGDTALQIPVELSAATPEALTIPFSLSGTAIEGTDFQAIEVKSVTIDAGATTGMITIVPVANNFVETAERTLTISLDVSDYDFLIAGENTEATIELTNDDEPGAYKLSFEETSFTTNEYLQESIELTVTLNEAFPEAFTAALELSGDAVKDEHYSLSAEEVMFEANERSATVTVNILNSKNYDNSRTLTVSIAQPENTAIEADAASQANISIINPTANVRLFAPDADYARLYAYNTFEDVAVPEIGRKNSYDTAGVVFDESFAFTIYEYAENNEADPNAFGFGSFLRTEEEYTISTNILNMHDFYGGRGPNTVDKNVSAGSAGLYVPSLFRLSPDAEGSTTGTVNLLVNEIKVYQKDENDTGNPPSFMIGVSGEGTYDEEAGEIRITITFDESAIGNGTQVRQYIFEAERRER